MIIASFLKVKLFKKLLFFAQSHKNFLLLLCTVLCGPSKRFFYLCLRHLFMTPKGQNMFFHLILRSLYHQKRSVKLLLLVKFHLQFEKKLIFISKNTINIKKKSGKMINSKYEQHFAANMHNMHRIRTGLLCTNNLV